MASARTRNAQETRADILAAARARFGAEGYERTTLRAVAADVGVDPALVIRYFGSKQDMFAAAAEFTLDLPDLTGIDPDRVAEVLLPKFFAVWEDDTTFVALLRAAMTSATAADTMRKVFATQVAPVLSAVTPRPSRPTCRSDGLVHHRPGDHPLRPDQPLRREPQPRRAHPLGGPGDPPPPGRTRADDVAATRHRRCNVF